MSEIDDNGTPNWAVAVPMVCFPAPLRTENRNCTAVSLKISLQANKVEYQT